MTTKGTAATAGILIFALLLGAFADQMGARGHWSCSDAVDNDGDGWVDMGLIYPGDVPNWGDPDCTIFSQATSLIDSSPLDPPVESSGFEYLGYFQCVDDSSSGGHPVYFDSGTGLSSHPFSTRNPASPCAVFAMGPPPTWPECGNFHDDDGDGLADNNDPDCDGQLDATES